MSTLNIGIITPTQGDPAYRNNWAQGIVNPNMDVLNAYTSLPLTKAVGGSSNVVLTLGTASVGEAQHTHFIFTGVLTGNIYVLWPAGNSFKFTAENQTTGAFTLSIGVDNGSGLPAGTSVLLPTTGALEFFSDGTDVTAISPALAAIANGTMLANESGSSATPTATNIPVLQSLVFTSNGTFTVPANANANTIFKFTVVGGGGGGGGAKPSGSGNAGGAGGGSGGAIIASFSGFTASSSVTVALGSGGTAGTSAGGNGGTGGSTTLTYSATAIVTASGGSGGDGDTGFGEAQGGSPGAVSTSLGSTGLTLVSSFNGGAQYGFGDFQQGGGGYTVAGNGGGNSVGTGGRARVYNSGGVGTAGTFGGGGGGGVGIGAGSGAFAGAAGGKGIVIVEWVL